MAFAVVSPGTIREAVECVQACVTAGVAILPQGANRVRCTALLTPTPTAPGANTGLTGGSVPRDLQMDRPTVVISTKRLQTVIPITGDPDGRVVCFAGAGIFNLRR